MKDYFNNSMKQVLSHFGKNGSMNLKEADEIISYDGRVETTKQANDE